MLHQVCLIRRSGAAKTAHTAHISYYGILGLLRGLPGSSQRQTETPQKRVSLAATRQ